MTEKLTGEAMVTALKAAAEPTRLRILALLALEELNVKDLTQILGQSQPRISRHLKLLVESGLVARFREGSWVYFHLSERTGGGAFAQVILDRVAGDDAMLVRDRVRMQKLRREREADAQKYFQDHAGDWDKIRTLHVPDGVVEGAMREALGPGPFEFFVDLGTGTGRVLEVFGDVYERGLGLDINQSMLSIARTKLEASKFRHAEVRHGDLYNLDLPDGCADAVVMHQVLHFMSEPGHVVHECGRILAPGGRLLIVDFAPHDLEFLRRDHAHERLGFSDNQMTGWLKAAGLQAIASRMLRSESQKNEETLTVTLWVSEQPATKQTKSSPHRKSRNAISAPGKEMV